MGRDRTVWGHARHAAWQQFGRRHWRWFVYPRLAVTALPGVAGVALLAGLGWAVAWAWSHVNPTALAWLTGTGAVVLAAGWAAYQVWTGAGVRRRVAGRLFGPGTAVLASVVLLAGACASVVVR